MSSPTPNLFIQCKPLDQLDWSAWRDFDEVLLIVSRPVLREIDNQKNRGHERLGRRARKASSLFREILTGAQGYKLVRNSGPRVKLVIEEKHNYTDGLVQLNYHERDDQLIGTVHKFATTYPDRDVRLLTHDTTPLATARSLDLKADVISDNWLLPPERTQTDKKIAALEADNARLRRAEPSFRIICQDSEGTTIERLETSYAWFEPLTGAEVSSLMQSLKDRFPIESDFGPRESARRKSRMLGSLFEEEFVPATDEEIADYRDEAYPHWLKRCEEILRNHHRTLQREAAAMPSFVFIARNDGTRPAKDALITIEARGNFESSRPRGTTKAMTRSKSGDQPVKSVCRTLRRRRAAGGRPPALERMEMPSKGLGCWGARSLSCRE